MSQSNPEGGPQKPDLGWVTQTLGDIPLETVYCGDHLMGAEGAEKGFPKTQE